MRRIALLLALMCSGITVCTAPVVVHADAPNVVVENIAHTQVIQTRGPGNSALPWGLDRINQTDLPLDSNYSYTATGTGVKAYIVDTGIKANHVEFAGRVASGWSYRSASQSDLDTWNSWLGSCKDDPYYDPADHPTDVDVFDFTRNTSDVGSPDNNGHGTHVAGSIGGTTTGVAKGVTLVPVRVLNSCGSGVSSMVLGGLDWILDDHELGEPAVVNMSIGFDTRDSDIDAKIAALVAEGIVVVAAAGNEGTTACNTTPAASPGAISVGASGSADIETSWSNYGTCVDLYAPGLYITSAWNYQGSTANPYAILSGTSMASPHVAGAVARYLQGVVTTSTTAAETWSWLDANTSKGKITAYVPAFPFPARTQSTPNKLLAMTSPDDLGDVTISPDNQQLSATWTSEAGLPYVMTTNPGGGTCTSTTSTCSITGLTNGQIYAVSISGTDSFNTRRVFTRNAMPVGTPVQATDVSATAQSRSLAVAWTLGEGDSAGITYTATATPGEKKCSVMSGTSCTITGLVNNTPYSVSVNASNGIGSSIDSAAISATPVGAPVAVTGLNATAQTRSLVIAWTQGTGDGTGITYTATATPGGFTCTSSTSSCTIEGLTNGIEYSVSVVGSNGFGTAEAVTVKKTPDGIPEAPATATSSSKSKSLSLSWSAVTTSINVTYVVTSETGDVVCRTTQTSCVVGGLTNGVEYNFTVTTNSATGQVSVSSLSLSARPGFTVVKTMVTKKSSTLLSRLLTSMSPSKKTWKETGPCRISKGRLVAPNKKTKCVVRLTVAKSRKFPAMSTRLTISVK